MSEEFAKKIKDITGLSVKEFIKVWRDRDQEWTKGMSHVETHGLRCLRMINGEEQWDKSLETKRKEEGRPCLSENLLPDFVNKPHGEFCMSAPQADVDPVDSKGDTKTADIIKGIIYNTSYQFSGSALHKDAYYYLLACGMAAWRVNTKFVSNSSWNVEPTLKPIINPFAVRWDLSAIEPDLSDKKWVIILDSMEESEFKKEYGEDLWKPRDWSNTEGTSKNTWWAEKKATVAEVWWIQEDPFTLYETPDGKASREKPSVDVDSEGNSLRSRIDYDRKIWSCVISSTDVLTEPVEWPDYTDRPIVPVVVAHGRKIVVAGKINFKAIISDGLDIQQLHNYWITANTEVIALQPDAPYIATDAQVKGFDEWTDASKKVRYLRYRYDPKAAGPPQRQSPPQLSSAMMAMPQYTRQALRDVIGLQQASLGISGNEKSGVAIQKRKQEGDAGKFPFVENMTRAIELEAKILVNILPSIMDTPRVERIMGADGSRSIAYIKQKDPRNKGAKPIDLSVGKYDVRVTTGPTFSTQRDEHRDMLSQLLQYLGPVAPAAVAAIAPKFLKLLNSPDADEMARIMVATLPPNLQAFYAEDNEDAKVKLPPEVMAQIQDIAQKYQQAQQVMQAQAQEIGALKTEQALEIKKLESTVGLEKERIRLERERIMRDITIKEKDIQAKKEIELEKISAHIELELTKLMETFKGQKELEGYKQEISSKAAKAAEPIVPATSPSIAEAAPVEPAAAPAPTEEAPIAGGENEEPVTE